MMIGHCSVRHDITYDMYNITRLQDYCGINKQPPHTQHYHTE